MRRRFILCLLTVLFSIIILFFLLMSVLGVINPANHQLEQTLMQQLDYSAEQLTEDMDLLAAHSVEFSEEMSDLFVDCNVPFSDFRNNQELLSSLQEKAYSIVRTNMRIAKCSGAFYFLDTTVNDSLPETYYNGIYLKYANLNSENTTRNSVCMYRGNSQTARQNDINLHSTWEYETKSDTFPQAEALLKLSKADPSKDYLLTSAVKLPNAWERVRFLCTPITDPSGNVVGVCGFEISDLFFQLSYQTSAAGQEYIVFALLSEEENGYSAQISSNRSGYMPHTDIPLELHDQQKLSYISNEEISLVGKTKPIQIGTSAHSAAVLMPENIYTAALYSGQAKLVILLLSVAILAVFASLWLSKQYVAPILAAMEQLKSEPDTNVTTHILEIDNLFEFFALKNQEREEQIAAYHQQAEQLQAEMEQLRDKYESTKTELVRIAGEAKQELNPDNYAMFAEQLNTLTAREREIFDLYTEGKGTKDIIELLNISMNTLKFHNKNIYSKLGVPSRKELLRYAAILKQNKSN